MQRKTRQTWNLLIILILNENYKFLHWKAQWKANLSLTPSLHSNLPQHLAMQACSWVKSNLSFSSFSIIFPLPATPQQAPFKAWSWVITEEGKQQLKQYNTSPTMAPKMLRKSNSAYLILSTCHENGSQYHMSMQANGEHQSLGVPSSKLQDPLLHCSTNEREGNMRR